LGIERSISFSDWGALLPFTEEDAVEAADFPPRSTGRLSFGDRVCLALAARFEVSAVTTDGAWRDLPEVGVAVKLIL